MSEYTTYQSKPTQDDAPDTCQYAECTTRPSVWVRYRNEPAEYVCYCQEHGDACLVEFTDAKSLGRLR